MIDCSDRHRRATPGLKPIEDAAALSVRVEIAPAWAATPAGQATIGCLINLLSRQTDLVTRIHVIGADVPLQIRLPGAPVGSSLGAALKGLAAWATGAGGTVVLGDGEATVSVGVGAGAWTTHPNIVGLGDGWRAWVGLPDLAPAVAPGPSPNPLGPFLAAAMIAGEVFKQARGVTRGRALSSFGHSLWSGLTGRWADMDDGPPVEGLLLPPFYMVGAGAVGQALAYVLGAAGLTGAYVVVIDDDRHDSTNLNRCLLAGAADVEHAKVDAVRRHLVATGVGVHASPVTLKDYLSRPRPGLRADLATDEAELIFRTIVSCVDTGASRQDIQGLGPSLIVGGSTSGLTAKTNVYTDTPGTLCLGCHNPREDDAEAVRRLERELRTMSPSDRRVYLTGKVADVEAVLASLDQPRCGSVGERLLRAHAVEKPKEFSVGFVSLAAGVLVGSRLFAQALSTQPQRGPMTSIAFLSSRAEDAEIARDAACVLCPGTS